MSNKKEDIKRELKELVLHGRFLTYHEALANEKLTKEQKAELNKNADFKEFIKSITSSKSSYQTWYSKSCQVIKQLMPDRLEEFRKLYLNEKELIKT